MSWLVYRLTGSAILLGLVSFASQFPAFIVSPFAGVHIDRLNRKKVLIITQALSAFQSLTLGILTITKVITVPQLIGLGICQALIDGFYIPARQVFISELLSRRADLANAIALNSASFHLARLVGPAIGGILIAIIGEGPCFLLDAISYGAVLISLFTITVNHVAPTTARRSVLKQMKEGIEYIRFHPMVRLLLANMSFICLIGIAHSILLPILVRDVYLRGPQDLGFLTGASGFGALIGALTLATQVASDRLVHRIQVSGFCFAAAVIMLGLSPSEWISLPLLAISGFFFITVAAGSSTVIQIEVEDRFRGRVMSFFAMTFTGMMPLGAVASGTIANQIGAQNTIIGCGVICLFGASAFVLTRRKNNTNQPSNGSIPPFVNA